MEVPVRNEKEKRYRNIDKLKRSLDEILLTCVAIELDESEVQN